MQGCKELNEATRADMLDLFNIRLVDIKEPIERIRRGIDRVERLIELNAPVDFVALETNMIQYRALVIIGKYEAYHIPKQAKADAEQAKYAADFAKELNQAAPEESTGRDFTTVAGQMTEEAKAISKTAPEESTEWGFTPERAMMIDFNDDKVHHCVIRDRRGFRWAVCNVTLNGNSIALTEADSDGRFTKTITQQDYKDFQIVSGSSTTQPPKAEAE